jgi:hypothetical protein
MRQKLGRIFAQLNPKSRRVTVAAHAPGGRTRLVHRLLLPGAGEMHAVDGDLLDLRRCNLQLRNRSERLWAMRKSRGASRYKGVSYLQREQCWRAGITVHYKHHFLGHFSDEVAAANAYDDAARRFHGDTAKLNFAPPAQPAVGCAVAVR